MIGAFLLPIVFIGAPDAAAACACRVRGALLGRLRRGDRIDDGKSYERDGGLSHSRNYSTIEKTVQSEKSTLPPLPSYFGIAAAHTPHSFRLRTTFLYPRNEIVRGKIV